MGRPSKYSPEFKRDAVALVRTTGRPINQVARELGLSHKTLRNWVRQAEIDGGVRPGTTTAEAERIAKLEQEVRELRRADHILKTSAAFFAAELDRPTTR